MGVYFFVFVCLCVFFVISCVSACMFVCVCVLVCMFIFMRVCYCKSACVCWGKYIRVFVIMHVCEFV